ncbi:acetoacetate decarboxylase family protein [Variovorax humicola]|uniref:Acetoacetate decarboxylase family protein n=1 Tax=Variovorax humicola TaxID=1769758 RepID=A0ABU8VZ08_9BURK
MKIDDVRKAFAMPATSPAFPPGPYRFVQREFVIITYRTDMDALRAVVPEPLEVTQPLVKYEFIRMPDSTGFGDYTESGQVIPHVDGTPRICELVRYHMVDIDLKGAWTGPAALELHPHALAPVAALPVREVVSAMHYIADMTLQLGTVELDYLA